MTFCKHISSLTFSLSELIVTCEPDDDTTQVFRIQHSIAVEWYWAPVEVASTVCTVALLAFVYPLGAQTEWYPIDPKIPSLYARHQIPINCPCHHSGTELEA